MKKILFIAVLVLSMQSILAQKRTLTADIFTNATTLPIHPKQLFAPIHPGLTIGTEFSYNKSERNQIGQTLKLGFFHHRLVQNAIQLYSEFHYSYQLKMGLGFDGMIGGGYLHSIPDHQIFKFNNGAYEKKPNWGKPEIMGTFSIGAGYFINQKENAKRTRVILNYQFWLQTPFVNSYVPVLPNTAIHIGVSRQLFSPSPNPKF